MGLGTMGPDPMLWHKIKQHPTFFMSLFVGFRGSISVYYLFLSISNINNCSPSLSLSWLWVLFIRKIKIYRYKMRIQFFEFCRAPGGLWSSDSLLVHFFVQTVQSPAILSHRGDTIRITISDGDTGSWSQQIGMQDTRYWKLKSLGTWYCVLNSGYNPIKDT